MSGALRVKNLIARLDVIERRAKVDHNIEEEDEVDHTIKYDKPWRLHILRVKGNLEWDLKRVVDCKKDDDQVPSGFARVILPQHISAHLEPRYLTLLFNKIERAVLICQDDQLGLCLSLLHHLHIL